MASVADDEELVRARRSWNRTALNMRVAVGGEQVDLYIAHDERGLEYGGRLLSSGDVSSEQLMFAARAKAVIEAWQRGEIDDLPETIE